MRFDFVGFRPLHLVSPLILFPLTYLLFLFRFMSSCLPHLSFFCAHTARPLVCTCTTYLQPRLQVAPVFTMRGGLSSFVPCAVPFHRNHLHLCPVLSPFRVFTLLSLLRRHTHTCTSVLALALLASPSGRRVCAPLGITGNLLVSSRGHAAITQTHANEAMREVEARSDQPAVLAFWNC